MASRPFFSSHPSASGTAKTPSGAYRAATAFASCLLNQVLRSRTPFFWSSAIGTLGGVGGGASTTGAGGGVGSGVATGAGGGGCGGGAACSPPPHAARRRSARDGEAKRIDRA